MVTKQIYMIQGKSEGFDSCDRPSNLSKKTIGHLSYATLSFLHHFVAIGEFKLELQSGNT